MIGFPREALVTLVALAILAQAGCPGNGDGDGDDQPPELPFSGHELSVAAPNGYRLGTSLRPLLDEWSARTGGSIKKLTLIERKPSIVPDRTADNWWPRHTDGADLIVFPLTEIGALMAAGRLGVLKDDRAADDGFEWRDLFIGLRNQAGQLGTPAGPRPVVLPICVPVLVLYVRTDLLEAAGRRPPRTWDEYQSLVEDVEHWAAGLPVIEPWGKSFRSTMFLARAVAHARHPANYSLFFDIRSGEPLIGSPAFVRALEQAAGAVEAMPEAVRSYSPADCRRLILAGRAAMAVTFEPGPRPGQVPFAPGPSVSTAEAVERPGEIQIGFARLPGVREVFDPNRRSWETLRTGRVHAVSLVGFAGLGAAVGAGHDEPIAARDLLELLAVEASTASPAGSRARCRPLSDRSTPRCSQRA